jgi:hypothetical protein
LAIDSTPPSVTLTSFTGGQAIRPSTSQVITWTASDTVGLGATPITVQISANGGSTWANVATNEANDGTYTWNVGALANSATYRIRVERDRWSRPQRF